MSLRPLFFVLLCGWLSACGAGGPCVSACERVYAPDDCSVDYPGLSQEDLLGLCEEACAVASRPEKEAWQDCVEAASCDTVRSCIGRDIERL